MSHYSLHLDRSQDFFDEGNYSAAKAAAEKALTYAQPEEGSDARRIIALSLRKLEFNDEALDMLCRLVETEPSPEICAEYALMCAERGNCDENCRNFAQRAIEEDPDLPSAYIAMFWCDAESGEYLEALQNLKKGMLRGADFSDSRAFELIRGWCQDLCNQNESDLAFKLTTAVVDLFNNTDFLVLHARIAEINNEHRVAVSYYKRALSHLRQGSSLRIEILEAIANIAI
ncbi:MAG: hypothetical protein IKY83_00185 [Proteobacteria bacterium]|nr:hypothetical protein [Pseudomonadota bacterium]